MKILKTVSSFDELPRGYRVAWLKYGRPYSVCAPFGAHLAYKLAHKIWELTFRYKPTKLEKLCDEVRQKAVSEGVKIGRDIEHREQRHHNAHISGDSPLNVLVAEAKTNQGA